MYKTWIRRVGFLVASAVVPILANAVRVFGIVVLAHVSNNRIAAGVDHIIYGWIFFTVVMALLLTVGGWWREKSGQRAMQSHRLRPVPMKTNTAKRNVNPPLLRLLR